MPCEFASVYKKMLIVGTIMVTILSTMWIQSDGLKSRSTHNEADEITVVSPAKECWRYATCAEMMT